MAENRSHESSQVLRCPSCGVGSLPTDVFCMGCGTKLRGASADLGAHAEAESAGPRGPAGERKLALIPRVQTVGRGRFGSNVYQGAVIVTDRRVVFAATEVTAGSSKVTVAGILGGAIGAGVAAAAVTRTIDQRIDPDASADQILTGSEHNFQIPYDSLESVGVVSKRNQFHIVFRSATDKTSLTMSLIVPDGYAKARHAEGMKRRDVWDDYFSRCWKALEKALAGAGVKVVWNQ